MAYPTVSAPYGFQPINRIGGNPYAGSTRLIPVDSGAVYDGDLVELLASGKCAVIASGSSVAQCLGVCVGVQYTNSSGQTVQAQYAPASGVTNVVAYVVDDPRALFKVAMVSSGTTIAGLGRTAVGQNTSVVLNAGVAASGDSQQAISTTTNTTNTLPIRIVDVVPETAVGADSYVEFIVKINTHTYNNTTGVIQFTQAGNYALEIMINSQPSSSNKNMYFYGEVNLGSGWTPVRYSGRTIPLLNIGQQQFNITSVNYWPVGTQVRIYLWGDATVSLKTADVDSTPPGTVTMPAVRLLLG